MVLHTGLNRDHKSKQTFKKTNGSNSIKNYCHYSSSFYFTILPEALSDMPVRALVCFSFFSLTYSLNISGEVHNNFAMLKKKCKNFQSQSL